MNRRDGSIGKCAAGRKPESSAELSGRAPAGADPPADVVALVTHGDTIRALQAVVAGLGPDQLPAVTPHNGSVTRLELP